MEFLNFLSEYSLFSASVGLFVLLWGSVLYAWYTHFHPSIVKVQGLYVLRKWNVLHWQYLGTTSLEWYSKFNLRFQGCSTMSNALIVWYKYRKSLEN